MTSGPTVLIWAQAEDDGARLVADAVTARGAVPVRLDTADYPAAVSFAARPDQPGSPGWLRIGDQHVELGRVRAVHRSHPARFRFPAAMSGPERRFATAESLYGWGGVFAAQPWRWVDHPGAVAAAAYKPHQLRVAAASGLNVPPTLVANSGPEARKFAAELGGDVVYKSMSGGVVTEQDELRIIYTTQLGEHDLDECHDEAIRLCPVLLQHRIRKAFDVRLTVVGDRCFAVAVHAETPEGEIDWRSRYDELTYRVCPTPPQVRAGVLAYLREFGLTFGAFDFAVSPEPDGRWWYLECNPAGRWAWLAEETGLPIAEALADQLLAPA